MMTTKAEKNWSLNEREVQSFIEGDEIRGKMRQDGGDIAFERLQGTRVFVCLKAACSSCPSASRVIEHFVERKLRERFGPSWTVDARREKPYFRR